VLWPVNARPTRAGAVTWELSVRPEATLPHRYRPWGRWSVWRWFSCWSRPRKAAWM